MREVLMDWVDGAWPLLLQNWQRDVCGPIGGTVHTLGRILKVGVASPEDIRDKRLRIAVHERKPGGLNLQHDPMAFLKRVIHVWQRERDLGDLARLHRFGLVVAAAEAGAKRFTAHKHL